MTGDVDGDDVAFLHQGNGAAHCCLRGNMADGSTTGGTGEPAVGNEGHGASLSTALNGRGGIEHLPHARAALGALVADDDDVAVVDLAAVDGLHGVLLAVKDTGGAFVYQHLRHYGRPLDHAGIRGQVALQHGDATGGAVGIFHGTDDLRVQIAGVGNVFANGLAGAGNQAGVEQAQPADLMHDGVDAASLVQVLHIGGTGGGQMAEVGGFLADGVGNVHVQVNAALMGNGGQVKHRVGGAAQGHIHGQGVLKGLFGHDVPGTDVLPKQFHNLHTGVLGQDDAGGVDGGNRAVARQAHAQHLGQAVHRVGGVHTGAAAAGGAGLLLILQQLLFVNLAALVSAHGLEHGGQAGLVALHPAGHHRAARNKDGGQVEPGCCHQQAGDVLVTVGHHDQSVKGVGHGHGFGRVGNQVPGHQGVLHTGMAHGDTVADGDGGKDNGGAASHGDTGLDGFDNLIQVHMSGDNVILGTDNAHQRAVQFLPGHAQGMEQGTVCGALGALGYCVTSHGNTLPFYQCCMITLYVV